MGGGGEKEAKEHGKEKAEEAAEREGEQKEAEKYGVNVGGKKDATEDGKEKAEEAAEGDGEKKEAEEGFKVAVKDGAQGLGMITLATRERPTLLRLGTAQSQKSAESDTTKAIVRTAAPHLSRTAAPHLSRTAAPRLSRTAAPHLSQVLRTTALHPRRAASLKAFLRTNTPHLHREAPMNTVAAK